MPARQRKINSGFGANSTAAEVARGVDLTGRLAVVTGGYSGIGLETVRALADAGARVIVPARRPQQADDAVGGIERVEVDELDLANLNSVGDFADRFLATGRGVDILINNAGIMAPPETRVGPGWEAQFAINHLGHYALTNHLWPALVRRGARVVSVSSNGHQLSGIHWNDVHFEHKYDKWQAYGQSKTANALFALHLDTLGEPVDVRAFSVHPGAIRTPLARHLSERELAEIISSFGGSSAQGGWKTPQQGAATQVWAATSTQLDGLGGVYCEDCDIAEHAPPDTLLSNGVSAWATDPHSAARLWQLSAELAGIDAFAPATNKRTASTR